MGMLAQGREEMAELWFEACLRKKGPNHIPVCKSGDLTEIMPLCGHTINTNDNIGKSFIIGFIKVH